MRMYIYLDKDIIKCLAPKVSNISFDIDFFFKVARILNSF